MNWRIKYMKNFFYYYCISQILFFCYVTYSSFSRARRVALLAPQFIRRDFGLHSIVDLLARTNFPRARGLQHNLYTPVAAF